MNVVFFIIIFVLMLDDMNFAGMLAVTGVMLFILLMLMRFKKKDLYWFVFVVYLKVKTEKNNKTNCHAN